MTNAIQYLEAAKADQVAAELEAEGYKVIREPEQIRLDTDFPFSFDLILNNDLRIAVVHQIKVGTSSFDD